MKQRIRKADAILDIHANIVPNGRKVKGVKVMVQNLGNNNPNPCDFVIFAMKV